MDFITDYSQLAEGQLRPKIIAEGRTTYFAANFGSKLVKMVNYSIEGYIALRARRQIGEPPHSVQAGKVIQQNYPDFFPLI